uniref:Uncharacterized protein n=1 Tax=Alhagi bacilliform virus TaxID=1973099 RepID=A0A2D0WLS8_9VIRU|nr:hypothetical protein [Alhagi bacilliform virus]
MFRSRGGLSPKGRGARGSSRNSRGFFGGFTEFDCEQLTAANQYQNETTATTVVYSDGRLVEPKTAALVYQASFPRSGSQTIEDELHQKRRNLLIKNTEYNKLLRQAATIEVIFQKELEATLGGGRDSADGDARALMPQRKARMECLINVINDLSNYVLPHH